MRLYSILIRLQSITGELTGSEGGKVSGPTNGSLFQQLPAQKARPIKQRGASYYPPRTDYRFGPIRIDWVDFDTMSQVTGTTHKDKDMRKRGPATATFVQQSRYKSGSTNLPEGTVHIFRQSAPPSSCEEPSSASIIDSDNDGLTLGILAVPAWMTPSEFLAFVAPAADSMAHLRIIRDSVPNRSMVVIKFNSAADATEFAEAYNGKPFNSIEPEICHVVHVLSVEIEADGPTTAGLTRFGPVQGSMYELPTCPVCLERMDSAVTGLITVPCSHTFHCMCLSKWGDSRCPVCRYSQTLLSSHPTSANTTRSSVPIPFADPSTPTLSCCVDCSATTNLWICLICGNIGCGRYGRAHAHAHYQSTTHLYALELETQRVWDYAADMYVHRLIQNKADGKLVELPSASSSVGTGISAGEGEIRPGPADALSAEKIEAIGIEYSYLLTSQLDSQRTYYEEQTMELKQQVEALTRLVGSVSEEFEAEKAVLRDQEVKRRHEEELKIAELERVKAKAEKRAEKVTELVKTLQKELKEERAVCEGLMKNLGKMKEKVALSEIEKKSLTVKIADLEEQIRDVMFFVEAKTKIEQGTGPEAEAAGGSIQVVTPPLTQDTARMKKKSPRKG